MNRKAREIDLLKLILCAINNKKIGDCMIKAYLKIICKHNLSMKKKLKITEILQEKRPNLLPYWQFKQKLKNLVDHLKIASREEQRWELIDILSNQLPEDELVELLNVLGSRRDDFKEEIVAYFLCQSI